MYHSLHFFVKFRDLLISNNLVKNVYQVCCVDYTNLIEKIKVIELYCILFSVFCCYVLKILNINVKSFAGKKKIKCIFLFKGNFLLRDFGCLFYFFFLQVQIMNIIVKT